jgi:DNA polymerase-3 subunit epsilon
MRIRPVASNMMLSGLRALLQDAVTIGHNAAFDANFLRSEFERMGTSWPDPPRICTLQLSAADSAEVPSRSLGALCEHFGIKLQHAHSAHADALAARDLFLKLVSSGGGRSMLSEQLSRCGSSASGSWSLLPRSGTQYTRLDAVRDARRRQCYLADLLSRLPTAALPGQCNPEYLALLERTVEDRRVEAHEAEALIATAQALGLSHEDIAEAHAALLRGLIAVALQDGHLSEAELRDLRDVGALLSVAEASIDRMIAEHRANASAGASPVLTNRLDLTGKSVCFTGAFQCKIQGKLPTREDVEAIAGKAGLVVKPSVVKSLDLLVTADPHSLSGNAKKARD